MDARSFCAPRNSSRSAASASCTCTSTGCGSRRQGRPCGPRRHAPPRFIRETQLGMLDILAEGRDVAGFRETVPEAIRYVRRRLHTLRTGQVALNDLAVTHRLAREPAEFVVRTAAARVAQQLTQAGVQLSPGESLRFVYVPGPEKARAWELVEGRPPSA